MRRCALTAMGFGLLFAAADVAALQWLDVGPTEAGASELQFGSIVSGIWFTAAGYGVFGMLYGTATMPCVPHPRLLRAAALLLGAALAGALLANLVSAVLCLYSGSYLTYGALQFTLNSFAHVSGAALSGHAATLAGMAVGSAVLCGFLTLLLTQPLQPPARRRRRWLTASLPLPAFIAVADFEGFNEPRYEHEVWSTTPELAFYSSFEKVTQALPHEQRPRLVTPGPKLTTGKLWKSTASTRRRPPNILLMVLESVSPRFLGYLGNTAGVTPHLDQLAASAFVWRRAWSTATHSNYAQMALLSSLLPRRGRGLDTYERLDYPRFLLHDALAHLGYETATISSQDENWQGMRRFQTTRTRTHFFDANQHDGPRVDIISEQIVPDHLTAARALRWIEKQDGPWSLYVNFQATHFPYRLAHGVEQPFEPHEPTPESFNYLRYPKRERELVVNRYKNALHYVDAQVGRIRAALERSGQLENTLWVVTADHGEMFHGHGVVTHGRTLFEGEARVPLLVHWPRGVEAGGTDQPVSTLDALPTILSAIGAPAHPAHQGTPLLAGGEPLPSRRAVLLNIQGLRSVEGIVCWPFKLIRNVGDGRIYLFNLESDPEEEHDLASRQAPHARRLQALLRDVMAAQDAYHGRDETERRQRYAPRIPRCPD